MCPTWAPAGCAASRNTTRPSWEWIMCGAVWREESFCPWMNTSWTLPLSPLFRLFFLLLASYRGHRHIKVLSVQEIIRKKKHCALLWCSHLFSIFCEHDSWCVYNRNNYIKSASCTYTTYTVSMHDAFDTGNPFRLEMNSVWITSSLPHIVNNKHCHGHHSF